LTLNKEYQNVDPDALVHWYRHHYIRDVEVDEHRNRIQIIYRFPVGLRAACTYAVADYVQGVVDDTLREIDQYVPSYQVAFRLESADINESPNVDSLQDNV